MDGIRRFVRSAPESGHPAVATRLKGVLKPTERQLAKTTEGVEMVKRLRQNLIAQGRDQLCQPVGEIAKAKNSWPFYRYRCAARRTGLRLYDGSGASERELARAPLALVKTDGKVY